MNTTNLPDYELICSQVRALADTESDYVALFSNISALLDEAMDDINWVGFYLMDRGSLLVGPFQGKSACIRIDVGKGVCGSAVEQDSPLRVDDVHSFEGHIACDATSASEIVIPIHSSGMVVGVLDIDSPNTNRFTAEDEAGLSKVVSVIEEVTDFSRVRI